MPSISKNEADKRLTREIEQLEIDDLVEVYNELFPEEDVTLGDNAVGRDTLATAIRDYICQGLQSEEIVDLWNVVFPKDRNVWFDDAEDTLRFNEEPGHFEFAD